jgi:tetratricopeptide (TPR) repeat protein
MSTNLARAQLLLAQSRPADAEREALLALAAYPESTAALALLALSRSAQQKGTEALTAAETAVGLAPDDPYLHYIRAITLHRLDRQDAARSAVNDSLRLDPENEECFALLSAIELGRGDWSAALAAAEQALALNPENVEAANFRAMALVRLGRKAEATQAVDFALHRAPENALSHANQGWNYLHRNEPRRAQEFFREALRLEPGMEYARQGMLEALRARNPIYRGMLAYFLWMGRQGAKFQWAFVIGTYFFSRYINTLLNSDGSSWGIVVFAVAFYGFVYLSWTAHPMFNLLLHFDRFGRHVLSRDERHATWWFGCALAAALGFLVWWPLGGGGFAMVSAIVCAAVSICLAATFSRTGRARLILGSASLALALVGITGLYGWLTKAAHGGGTLGVFFMGFLGFQVLANFVRKP